MAVQLSTINGVVDTLATTSWANLNLIMPRCLAVPVRPDGSLVENKEQLPYVMLRYATSPNDTQYRELLKYNYDGKDDDTATGVMPNGLLPLLTKISGLDFVNTPLEKKNGQIVPKSKPEDGKEIVLEFLLDKNFKAITLYKNWYNSTQVREFNTTDSESDLLRLESHIKSSSGSTSYEGGLLCTYVDIEKDARGGISFKSKGELYIAGLVPTRVDMFKEVGPGIAPQSQVPTVKIHCVYSFGYLQLDMNMADLNLEVEDKSKSDGKNTWYVSDTQRLWLV